MNVIRLRALALQPARRVLIAPIFLRVLIVLSAGLCAANVTRGDSPTNSPLNTSSNASPNSSTDAQALFDAGRALAGDHDHAGAVAKYAQALKLDPARADIHAYKAASLVALHQLELAQGEIDSAIALNAREFSFYEIAGQIKIAGGQIDAGKALYDKAAGLSPFNAGAVDMDLAAALAAKDDPRLTPMIESALKAAAAANPPSAEALFQLGQSYAQAGRAAQAKQYLQRYLDTAAKLPADQRDARKMKVARQLMRAMDLLK